MPRYIASRSKILASAALAAGIAAVVGAVILARQRDEVARAAWRVTILTATAEELPALLQELDEQPEITVGLLVELLGSEQPEVASAAGHALHQLLEQWRRLPSEQSTRRIAMLSAELANRLKAFPPPGQQIAAGLAREILLWPLDDVDEQSRHILVNCEIVLRATGASRKNETTVAREVAIAGRPPIPADLETPEVASRRRQNTPAQLAPLPEVAPHTLARQPQPRSLPEPPVEFHPPLATALRLVEKSPPDAQRHSSDRVAVEEISNQEGTSQALSILSELELARLLHAADARVADAAEQELRSRGLGRRELSLVRALRHPDPREREAFARALPQIAGIDPQFWLNQLADDEDPQVRRTAINIVASGDDAATSRWLRAKRQQESDPQVARRIDELLRLRR